jgi:hypothetical protein
MDEATYALKNKFRNCPENKNLVVSKINNRQL